MLKQLNVRIGIHIRDHIVKILEISAANFCKRGCKLIQGRTQELERVVKYYVLPPLDLKILFHILTDNFDLAVRSLFKLVDDKVCIVVTEVVKEHWDFEAYRTLQVTLAVSSADKAACDVAVVTDFETLRLTLNKLVTADVAPSGIIIFLLLAIAEAFNRPIRLENHQDFGFSHDESVKKLGERVFSNFHHDSLVKVLKT